MKKCLILIGLFLITVGMGAEKSIYDRMLSKSIESGEIEKAQTLIDKGANVNLIKTTDFVKFNTKWMVFFTDNGYLLDRPNNCILRTLFWENRKNYIRKKSWEPKGNSVLDKLIVLLQAGADPMCQNNDNEPLLVEMSGEYSTNQTLIKSYQRAAYIESFKLIYNRTHGQLNLWFDENINNFRGRHWNRKNKKVRRKAIYLPIINNNKEVFRYLIEQGYGINSASYDRDGYSDMTPLEGALLMKDFNLIKLVIDKGADVNLEFYSEMHKRKITPIDFAHEWVLDETELYLLERGAKYDLFGELN